MRDDEGLPWAEKIAQLYDLKFAQYFSMDQLNITVDMEFEPTKKKLLVLAKELGYEGFVLKKTQFAGWYKVKEVQTIDAIITGIVPGKNQHQGLVGSVVVGLLRDGKLIPIANAGGMKKAERIRITKMHEQHKLIGLVVAVKYQEVGSQGRLRHPRYDRLRPDKPVNQCTWDQLEDNC
jgi:ATP-dependent DNA ligase